MSDVPRSLLLVAVWCFAGGAALGAAVTVAVMRAAEAPPQTGGAEDYVQRMRVAYDLRPDQIRLLRAVMADELSEREHALLSLPEKNWPETVKNAIERAGRTLNLRIEYILDGDQRHRWRRDLASRTSK